MCDMPWNRKAVNARDFERVKPTLAEIGQCIDISELSRLKLELVTAISDSMPKVQTTQKQPENPLAELQLRAFYCDIMGRSEKELFESNYKEINDRTERRLRGENMAETKSLVTRMTTNTTGFKTGTQQVIEQLNKFNKALVDNQSKQKECNN